jgi:hypothetical protein
MLIHDDIYSWQGWGRKLLLGSGKCRLRIIDLKQSDEKGLAFLRPMIVIVSDIPESKLSVRSCAGHIATKITKDFGIDPNRMQYLEYYQEVIYGEKKNRVIPERYDVVEFTWYEGKAIQPKWRPLKPAMIETIRNILEG